MVLDVILNSITRMEHQRLHMVHAYGGQMLCPLLVNNEMTTRWHPGGRGIRTAHWCSENPRLA